MVTFSRTSNQMAKRRKLSKVTRAKISRGLKRYYRVQREMAHRRSLAAKRAAITRKANRELRRLQQTKQVRAAPAPEPTALEEWEVTVKYTVRERGKHHGEVVDVTLRLIGAVGRQYTNAQVRAAAWYALKHGAESLTDFTLHAVDWYNTRRSGVTQTYQYEGNDRDTALENARGIFNTVGMGGLRVALVE